MTMRTNCFLLLTVLLGILPMSNTHANDSIPKSVILYTPYTKISVSPGASIDYSIDLINNTDKLVNANLSVSGLSSSWKHEMKSGGWNLSQLAGRKKNWLPSVRAIIRLSKPRWRVLTITTSYSSVIQSGTAVWRHRCKHSCIPMPPNLPENKSPCSPPAAAAAFPLRSARPVAFAPMRQSSTVPYY